MSDEQSGGKITYIDENGDDVSIDVLSLVDRVEVGAWYQRDFKQSDKNASGRITSRGGSAGASQKLGATVPPAMQDFPAKVRELAHQLYLRCAEDCVGRVETDINDFERETAQPPTEDYAYYDDEPENGYPPPPSYSEAEPIPFPQPIPAQPNQTTNVDADGLPPLLPFLKADDRKPGMRYRLQVSEFEVDESKRIRFYGPTSKYNMLTTYTDRASLVAAFPENFEFKPTGGNRWRFRKDGSPIIITIEVKDNKIGDSKYWDQDLIAVEFPD